MLDILIALLFLAGVFVPTALAASAVGGVFPVSDDVGDKTRATATTP